VIDDAQVFNDKLQEWEDFYNYHRPFRSVADVIDRLVSLVASWSPRHGVYLWPPRLGSIDDAPVIANPVQDQ
jgi:hypothetical protein